MEIYHNNNQKETKFDFYANVETDKAFFPQEQMNKYLTWEKEKTAAEEKRKQGYGYSYQYQGENPHKKVTGIFCEDCSKAIKKIKIKGYRSYVLEPELERLEVNIQSLKDTLNLTTKTKSEETNELLRTIISLNQKNNTLLEENNRLLAENTKIK
ncbi:MAG: hypothetical protein mread185_000005 [Mycoplasmataceae bacterium]|nr:MAG: hypothetical protein mread185_000005 [Mycoplasmataceae bacterium]